MQAPVSWDKLKLMLRKALLSCSLKPQPFGLGFGSEFADLLSWVSTFVYLELHSRQSRYPLKESGNGIHYQHSVHRWTFGRFSPLPLVENEGINGRERLDDASGS